MHYLTRSNWLDIEGEGHRVVARLWAGETDTGNHEQVRYLIESSRDKTTSIIGSREIAEEIHAGLIEVREYGSNLNADDSYHIMTWTSREEVDRYYEISRVYDAPEVEYSMEIPEPFLASRDLVKLATMLPELSANCYAVELTEYIITEAVNKKTGEIHRGVETRHSYGRDYRRGRMLAVWYDGDDRTQEAARAEMEAIDQGLLQNAY